MFAKNYQIGSTPTIWGLIPVLIGVKCPSLCTADQRRTAMEIKFSRERKQFPHLLAARHSGIPGDAPHEVVPLPDLDS